MDRAGLLPVGLLRPSIIALDEVNAAFDLLDRGEAARQDIRFQGGTRRPPPYPRTASSSGWLTWPKGAF